MTDHYAGAATYPHAPTLTPIRALLGAVGEPSDDVRMARDLVAAVEHYRPAGTMRAWFEARHGWHVETLQLDVRGVNLWMPGVRVVDSSAAGHVALGGSRRDYAGMTVLHAGEDVLAVAGEGCTRVVYRATRRVISSDEQLDSLMGLTELACRVHADGTVEPGIYEPGAPEMVYVDLDGDGQIIGDVELDRDGWEIVATPSGKVRHPSEFIGGGFAKNILATPGLYITVTVDGLTDDPDAVENELVGWTVLRKVESV